MYRKILASIAVILLLQSVALAQTYSIRITNNTNLRAWYSLDSAIVETAPAGATLDVMGSHNRWLRIDRKGKDVWMADWVAYTRVEDSASTTQAQATSNINNCCFVDRQCQTDQDWTEGYWAFQNGRCAVPARMQTQASTQPVNADTATVDNCCFIGWQCATDDDWLNGFQAYQTNQCKHPGIALEGSPGFILQMENALDMLRDRAPHWYDYVIRGLDRIRQAPPEVIGVHVGGRLFDLDYSDDPPPGVSYDSHTTHDAAMLVHEACHVHRYEAGLEPGGLAGESACVETEIQALEVINPNSGWIQYSRRVLANIHRPECQWWWGEYKTCYD
ncbi:MAG: hypothetical protein OXG60_16480 [Chloroflexi bacterium]|nr:hypothetical protein [Chloroflexota bacterium]